MVVALEAINQQSFLFRSRDIEPLFVSIENGPSQLTILRNHDFDSDIERLKRMNHFNTILYKALGRSLPPPPPKVSFLVSSS